MAGTTRYRTARRFKDEIDALRDTFASVLKTVPQLRERSRLRAVDFGK